MARTRRPGLSREKRVELWARWKAGQCASDIARELARTKSAIHHVLAFNGGIAPVAHKRGPGGACAIRKVAPRQAGCLDSSSMRFPSANVPPKSRTVPFQAIGKATCSRGPATLTWLRLSSVILASRC